MINRPEQHQFAVGPDIGADALERAGAVLQCLGRDRHNSCAKTMFRCAWPRRRLMAPESPRPDGRRVFPRF